MLRSFCSEKGLLGLSTLIGRRRMNGGNGGDKNEAEIDRCRFRFASAYLSIPSRRVPRRRSVMSAAALETRVVRVEETVREGEGAGTINIAATHMLRPHV